MKDVNYPLRKAYYTLLSGITYDSVAVPCYYQKAPNDIAANNYIVFGGINNNDSSTQHKADTDTSINVTIHTYQQVYNSGEAADAIAGTILSLIYPDKQTHFDMSDDTLQNVTTTLTNDFTQFYNILGSREYIDRILTFRHHIFHQ